MVAIDRNLLYGVLAVQLGFVSRDQLIAATGHWVLNKDQPLGEVFIQHGVISRADDQVLDAVVQKHLEHKDANAGSIIGSWDGFEDLRQTLEQLGDSTVPGSVEFETIGSVVDEAFTTIAPREQSVGESKNRYTILRTHQKGGLGCVSIALDEELNREIALKEILPAQADHEENRTRFIREAEITGALEHPGIVPVYSLGQFADGRPYYAMRFVRGVNLQAAIEDYHRSRRDSAEKQLAFRQLLSKIVDVCQALEYAHSRGVIHRDIKPGNIMLGDYGETLLVDWGLAKTLKDGFQTDESTMPPVHTTERASSTETQIGRVVGTPAYMSPEQAAGRLDSLDPASDIYSVGATLFHLLTGEPPFRGTEEEVIGNVQMGRFKRPRELATRIPRPLEAICLKAMARMPHDRYQSSREMADDLERYLADERVLAYSEPVPAKIWRWMRQHKALVGSSAAALAVALTALTIGVVLLSAANLRERAERERAEDNFAEATEQRELAERNFALARSAVHDYFITVSEDTLLQQPGMQTLREQLLRQALVYYQSFLDERADDPTLSQEVADAHFYAGSIVQAISSPREALPHFEKAAEIQRSLLAKSPEDAAIKSEIGQSLNAIGGVYFRIGKIDQARTFFQQASDVREEIAAADSQNVEAARVFANSVMNIGSTHLARQEYEQAVPILERAQMIRMAHVEQLEEADPKLQRDLAMGYYQLAIVRRELGDNAVAEESFLTAVQVFRGLLEAAPNEMGHQRNLAICLRGVADLKASQHEAAAAIDFLVQAQEILEQLKLRNPDVHNYAAELAGVYINQAVQYRKLERTADGLHAAERAVELLRDLTQLAETVPAYRMDLGIALREEGELLGASGDTTGAQERLGQSRTVLAELLKENPASERYATELGLTVDASANLEDRPEASESNVPANSRPE